MKKTILLLLLIFCTTGQRYTAASALTKTTFLQTLPKLFWLGNSIREYGKSADLLLKPFVQPTEKDREEKNTLGIPDRSIDTSIYDEQVSSKNWWKNIGKGTAKLLLGKIAYDIQALAHEIGHAAAARYITGTAHPVQLGGDTASKTIASIKLPVIGSLQVSKSFFMPAYQNAAVSKTPASFAQWTPGQKISYLVAAPIAKTAATVGLTTIAYMLRQKAAKQDPSFTSNFTLTLKNTDLLPSQLCSFYKNRLKSETFNLICGMPPVGDQDQAIEIGKEVLEPFVKPKKE